MFIFYGRTQEDGIWVVTVTGLESTHIYRKASLHLQLSTFVEDCFARMHAEKGFNKFIDCLVAA